MTEYQTVGEQKVKKISATLVGAVFLTCFGSSLLMGYSISILNNPKEEVMRYLRNTGTARVNSTFLSETTLYSYTAAVMVVAGAIGAFSSGLVADKIGRRNALLANHIPQIFGGIIAGFCVMAEQPALLYAGRFLSGLNAGGTIGIASLYLTEISPRHLRGMIGACHQLAVTIGIVFGFIIEFPQLLKTDTLWPFGMTVGIIPAIISLALLPCFPESPRFLFLKREDENGARGAFIRFNPNGDVEQFIGELREEEELAKSLPKFRFINLFRKQDLRMPLLIACIIQVMQQLSGINAVMTYGSSMLEKAGVPLGYIGYCMLGIGVINVAATILSVYLIERAGRRTLLLGPSAVLALCLLLLIVTVNVANAYADNETINKVFSGLSVFLVHVYTVSFALGLGTVPGLIVAEVFRQEPRAAAYSVSQCLQWTSNLLLSLIYPSLNDAIGGYSFAVFLVVVVVCWIFFFLFMPETRGRTFDEVARDLAFGNIVVGKKTTRIEDRDMAVFTKDSSGTGQPSKVRA